MKDSLSIQEARKLVLLSQRLPPNAGKGRAMSATLEAIEHLGYIQVDTISVIQRAHHHTLWNRNPRYQATHLDQLVDEKQVFEYWSHAASYLPMRDYRYSLPRKKAIAIGKQAHWFERNEKMEQRVLERIRNEGPLMAKDFEQTGKRVGDWRIKPAKCALENLYMQGDLMASRRVNFQKVYDLTERVLPSGIDTSEPSPKEHARHLITQFLKTNGLGKAEEIAYLRPQTKPLIVKMLKEMLAAGELHEQQVASHTYFCLPASLELLNKPLSRSQLKILSPFDNLVIQRKRMQALFGFDYLIECYTPAAKRKYGYFTLPILWDGRLAARMDCKAERKESRLHIHHLALEAWLTRIDPFVQALSKELVAFMKFNQCTQVKVHRTSPRSLHEAMQALTRGAD